MRRTSSDLRQAQRRGPGPHRVRTNGSCLAALGRHRPTRQHAYYLRKWQSTAALNTRQHRGSGAGSVGVRGSSPLSSTVVTCVNRATEIARASERCQDGGQFWTLRFRSQAERGSPTAGLVGGPAAPTAPARGREGSSGRPRGWAGSAEVVICRGGTAAALTGLRRCGRGGSSRVHRSVVCSN